MSNHQVTDLRQSEEYASYMKNRGWKIENIKWQNSNVKIFIRGIPLLGSVIKIQRPEAIPPEKELDKLAENHGALFIKVEPAINDQRSTINDLQSDSWPLLPSKTLQLDLLKSGEELWENLDPDAKYSIRKARSQLVAISDQESASIEKQRRLNEFYQLLKTTGKSKGFYTPKWLDLKAKAECFGKKAWLILAYRRRSIVHGKDKNRSSIVRHLSSPIAGCLLFIHDGIAYYHYAASSEEGRKLLAAYFVLWKAIKLAKSRGCHTFDFEGIYDGRFPKATRNWKGFTFFKKKFGGKEVEFPRPLIKYYSLPIKLLFKLFG